MKSLLALLFAALLIVSGCGESAKQPAAVSNFSTMPVEQMFATVAAGKAISADDPAVARAKQLIDRAANSFAISRIDVADQAFYSYKIAAKEGIDASAEQILEAVTLAHVPGAKMDFAEYCAMYLTLRKAGHPHAETMMGLKGIISALTAPAK